MTNRVPTGRATIAPSLIQAGRNVSSGGTWQSVGENANLLFGAGVMLVPATSPNTAIASGSSKDWRFRIAPQVQCLARVWSIGVQATGAGAAVVSVSTPTGGAARTYPTYINLIYQTDAEIWHEEFFGGGSAAEQEISIRIAATGGPIRVTSISCRGLPRNTLLADGSEQGTDVTSLRSLQPLYEDTVSSGRGISDVSKKLATALTTARRAGHHHFAYPDNTTDALLINSVGYAAIRTIDPPFLARKLYRTSTTGTISWKVLAATDAGGTGDVRINTTSGGAAVSTINIPNGTTFTWRGAPGTFTVDCEDLTVADGRRSTRWDEVTIEARATAGVIYIATASFWEA